MMLVSITSTIKIIFAFSIYHIGEGEEGSNDDVLMAEEVHHFFLCQL